VPGAVQRKIRLSGLGQFLQEQRSVKVHVALAVTEEGLKAAHESAASLRFSPSPNGGGGDGNDDDDDSSEDADEKEGNGHQHQLKQRRRRHFKLRGQLVLRLEEYFGSGLVQQCQPHRVCTLSVPPLPKERGGGGGGRGGIAPSKASFVTCRVRWSIGLFRHGNNEEGVFVHPSTLPDPLIYHRGLYFPPPNLSGGDGGGGSGGGPPRQQGLWRPCCPLPPRWLAGLWEAEDAPLETAARTQIAAAQANAAAAAATKRAAAYEATAAEREERAQRQRASAAQALLDELLAAEQAAAAEFEREQQELAAARERLLGADT
jgi:hypothetical protein